MTWRAVGLVYAVFALLLVLVLVVERPHDTTGTPPDSAPQRSLLGVESGAVRAVVFRRGERRIGAARDDGRWRTVEPAGASVPSDLVDAAVATVTAGQVSDVVGDGGRDDLEVFGLAAPASAIVLSVDEQGGTRDVTVLLGERNPTRTALYARRADDPRVYLVGLNLQYYEDLIFEAAGAPAR